jgi:hypothetical protein
MLSITARVITDGIAMGPVSRSPVSVKTTFYFVLIRTGAEWTDHEIPSRKESPPPSTGKPPAKRGLSLERRLWMGLQRVVAAVVAVAEPELRKEQGPRRALATYQLPGTEEG